MKGSSTNVATLDVLSCDGGWRNYFFVKITTEGGIVGWSEFDEWYASPGVAHIVQRLAGRVVGQSVLMPERIIYGLLSATRPALHGVIGEAIGAIENALLDAKARILDVPCYDLLGGKHRDTVRIYWSHCATWRILHPDFYPPAIHDIDGVRAVGREARERGFTGVKTNIFAYGEGWVRGYHPGYGYPYKPDVTVDRKVLRDIQNHLAALREGTGPDLDILIDLNFNAKVEGYIKILRSLEDFALFWVELDSESPDSVAAIRRSVRHPIAACETLFGVREFLPFLQKQAVDFAIVDATWNGAWQSMKIAHAADAYDTNIALHNFYGHLSTMMNLQLAAATPNFAILETDVDRLPWDEELFTHVPELHDGCFVVPDRPGWGTEPIETALIAHPPRDFRTVTRVSSVDG